MHELDPPAKDAVGYWTLNSLDNALSGMVECEQGRLGERGIQGGGIHERTSGQTEGRVD